MATDIGKAISSPVEVELNWEQHKELPTQVETQSAAEVINARLAPWRDTPIRWRRGIFRVPIDASPKGYESMRNASVKKFIREMNKEGWDLVGRVQVFPSKFEASTESGIVLIGQKEYVVRAQFEKRDCKPIRIEVPLVN